MTKANSKRSSGELISKVELAKQTRGKANQNKSTVFQLRQDKGLVHILIITSAGINLRALLRFWAKMFRMSESGSKPSHP